MQRLQSQSARACRLAFAGLGARPQAATFSSNTLGTSTSAPTAQPLPLHSPSACLSARLLASSAHVNAAAAAAATDTAEVGDFVRVHYTGTLEDGTQFDSSRGREPLEFVIGGGSVIRGFDSAVTGLSVGGSRKHTVQPADGYGEWREEMQATVPKKDVQLGQEVEVGTALQLGNGLRAVVSAVTDDTITIDANPPLAGKPLTFDVELLHLTKAADLRKATFGAGCFWGPELLFARVPGVVATQVGYSQGHMENPTYEDVCTGSTGHNEVVQVTYDEKAVSYEQLLQTFIGGHNPTQLNGQGNDTGTQYRSGIYTHSPEQLEAAKAFLQKAQADFNAPIVTEVEEIKGYTSAEDYHQQYLVKGGRFGRPQSARKGCNDPIRCYG